MLYCPWLLACALMVICMFGAPAWPALAADGAALTEHRIKAAYLYQFARYVEWPAGSFAEPGTPLSIAVVGDDDLAGELNQLVTGRTVDGRTISVRRLKASDALGDTHVLFIARGASASQLQAAQSARSRSILTVTESVEAFARGSIINFTVSDRRIRFEISLAAAEKSGLKLSSRLLAVAQQVHAGAP